MYEYIIGKITYITPSYIVVETAGIGYQITMGNPYYFTGKMEKEVKLFVHQVIRDDSRALFGFHTLEEKQLFLRLISVTGIGPKSGLAIMANEDHSGLVTAIETEDITYLTKFPGVGKKTAQQLILDLKGKVGEFSDQLVGTISLEPLSNQDTVALDEAMAALLALGYAEREVKRVKKELTSTAPATTDVYLRAALKLMIK